MFGTLADRYGQRAYRVALRMVGAAGLVREIVLTEIERVSDSTNG